MNLIRALSSQQWVERLGWTLVHFLWQGLSIAALYAAARRGIAGKAGPNTRYLLACAAVAAMMAAPLVTWGLMRPSDASPDAAYRIRSTPPAASTTGIAANTLPASVRATVSSIRSGLLDAATNSLATCHSSTQSPSLETRSSAIMKFVPGGQTLAEEPHPFNSSKEPLHRFVPVSAIGVIIECLDDQPHPLGFTQHECLFEVENTVCIDSPCKLSFG
jgi:hypothetical protein